MSRGRIVVDMVACFMLAGALLSGASAAANAACQLNSEGGAIKRVIFLVFDNVHLRRDKPNVPSDLEQMPNLLNFLLSNGTVFGNHWTPLISHTANDIITAQTGVYGDRHGVPVANSYGFFRPDGTVSIGNPSFLYWTATAADGKPAMINENGKIAPAPWVPFTRAGCDVGAFSVANIEIESIPADIRTFFGVGSPEDQQVTAALALPNTPANQPARQAPNTDYLGIAVHCAQNSSLCNNSHARPDLLPDEPGGYVGFSALFGNVNVAPVICPLAPAGCSGNNILDTNGTVIADAYGRPGFPNIFNPTAAQSLGYAATMLEAGLPIVYVYIADAHERNPLPLDPNTNAASPNRAFGPGEAEYVAQLKAYDTAFGKFFTRLTADGITTANTLFVVVPDENDHFVGSQPSPASCDGINIPCTYTAANEINADLNRLLLTQRSNSTPFIVHSDSAPTVYITGNPGPTDPVTRTLEKDMDKLTGVNPLTGNTDKLSAFLADRAEMKILHMVTASPARTPSFTMFGNPDYFFANATNNTNCSQAPACIRVPVPPAATFAWNHGDVQSDITLTWMAMVGPGVQRLGLDGSTFSDHTDIRPTMMALLGLKDDYVHDGRVLVEKLNSLAVPLSLQNSPIYAALAQVYKQLNAPLGDLGISSLKLANTAITADDATYAQYLNTMATITTDRDSLASQIKTLLNGAAFNNQPIDPGLAQSLIQTAQALITQVHNLGQAQTKIFAAVAPNARTTTVGSAVTAFATIINAGTITATGCSIALPPGVPALFLYQTTNPATNTPTGTADTPVNINPGQSQSFYFAITPSAPFSQDIALVFSCTNSNQADVAPGLNTLLLTATNTPIPDMVTIADTLTHDGNMLITGTTGTGVMAAATINIGAPGTVTFTPADAPIGQPPHGLPLTLSICQTNLATGACINPTTPGPSSTVGVGSGQIVAFSVFATGQGTLIPYDPANTRVFIIGKSGGSAVAEAGVAVKMQPGAGGSMVAAGPK